jgi:hypothetical protein
VFSCFRGPLCLPYGYFLPLFAAVRRLHTAASSLQAQVSRMEADPPSGPKGQARRSTQGIGTAVYAPLLVDMTQSVRSLFSLNSAGCCASSRCSCSGSGRGPGSPEEVRRPQRCGSYFHELVRRARLEDQGCHQEGEYSQRPLVWMLLPRLSYASWLRSKGRASILFLCSSFRRVTGTEQGIFCGWAPIRLLRISRPLA